MSNAVSAAIVSTAKLNLLLKGVAKWLQMRIDLPSILICVCACVRACKCVCTCVRTKYLTFDFDIWPWGQIHKICFLFTFTWLLYGANLSKIY